MPSGTLPQGSEFIVSIPDTGALDLAYCVSLLIVAGRKERASLFVVEIQVNGMTRNAKLTPVLMSNGTELAILTIDRGDGSSLFVVLENDGELGWIFPERGLVARDTRELEGLTPSEFLRMLGH